MKNLICEEYNKCNKRCYHSYPHILRSDCGYDVCSKIERKCKCVNVRKLKLEKLKSL